MTAFREVGLTLALVGAVFTLPGCAVRELLRSPEVAILPQLRPDPLYEEIVPYYAELCAASQYRPLGGSLGGIPGHAVMYLKGACVDESAEYPRLRPCRPGEAGAGDHEHGAGVSVNPWFKNVNWMAFPGKRLFLNGEVGAFDLLDRARFDGTVDRAIELGLYRGIRFHEIDGRQPADDLRSFVAAVSAGTDYALRFGRTLFCARLPLEQSMLLAAMEYLNDLNEEYFRGEQAYEWSAYSDNCVHTLHNSLAAAGVWKPKSVHTAKIHQLFHLAVPANTVFELAFIANKYPIEDFSKIRKDKLRWEGLTEHGWLPGTPGALVKTLPILQVNSLYDTRYRMFSLGGWLSNRTEKRAQYLMTDGRYLQLDANLRYYSERYQRILDERDEDGSWTDALRSSEYLADRDAYYRYIENARDWVAESIEALQVLERRRDAAGAFAPAE